MFWNFSNNFTWKDCLSVPLGRVRRACIFNMSPTHAQSCPEVRWWRGQPGWTSSPHVLWHGLGKVSFSSHKDTTDSQMLAPTGMDQPEVASLLFVQTLICGVPLVPAESGNLWPPHTTKMENLHRPQGFPKEANLYIFVGMILKDSPKDRQRFARTGWKITLWW